MREKKKEFVAPRTANAHPGKKAEAARQPKLDLGAGDEYQLPDLSLLETIIV